MRRKIKDQAAYEKIVDAFKKRKDGATVADIVAHTGIPLEQARGLLPVAADEFRGRLRVTESGEILYSFPQGFSSRYTGLKPTLKRLWKRVKGGAITVGTALFKVWIMVMLIGYFVFFIALALVALLASVAMSASGSSDNRSSSRRGGGLGGMYLASRVLDLVIRLWFYSELVSGSRGSFDGNWRGRSAAKPARKPLNRAVFSFVFGDGDPNADWAVRERKAVLAYIQANKGVITLPEFMAITGLDAVMAEQSLGEYLVEFGGSPEATEDGVVVYRFEDIMKRGDNVDRSFGLSGPLKRIRTFSNNPKKMNTWFAVLNGVNFLFGGYFLYFSTAVGPIVRQAQITGFSYLYAFTLHLLGGLSDPGTISLVGIALGWIPIVFAVLFYAIPLIRSMRESKANETVRMENLRKALWSEVWENDGRPIRSDATGTPAPELSPANLSAAREQALKELGALAAPEIAADASGAFTYAYPELARQKASVRSYRNAQNEKDYDLGATIFDSHQ